MLPALDMEIVKRLQSFRTPSGKSLWLELCQIFLSQTQIARGDLVAAYEARRWSDIEAVTHSLKSSSGSLGALRLSRMCNDLETYLRNNVSPDHRRVGDAVSQIADEAIVVEREVTHHAA